MEKRETNKENRTMKLQYSIMNSMGTVWIDANDRTDEFINLASTGLNQSVEQIKSTLLTGKAFFISGSWDDTTQIRDCNTASHKSAPELPKAVKAFGFEDNEDY